jgi:NADPH:quinone reductase-like Zn-dependent oxidoreductase
LTLPAKRAENANRDLFALGASVEAIQFEMYGPPFVMTPVTLGEPVPGPGEVRVRLRAAGVARADAKIRAGMLQQRFPLKLPKIPGRDGAGVIDLLGEGVTEVAVGDAVCVMADQVLPGTYAEALVCTVDRVVPHPSGLSVLEAAALLQPCNSAWIAVTETARVEAGMRVLVHGGAGAVGSQMIRLCRYLGAAVSTTCRADNRDHVASLGAERAIAYDREDFTQLGAQDVVFDMVGGETHARSYQVLRHGGHLVYLNAAPIIDEGSRFGVRVSRAQISDRPPVFREVAKLAAEGVFRPRVAGVFRLADAAKAHAVLEAGQVTRGRLVLDIGGPALPCP